MVRSPSVSTELFAPAHLPSPVPLEPHEVDGINMSGLGLKTNGTEKDLDESKRLKVQLPVRQHLQLHRIKVLAGQNLSESVRRALDLYFEQLEEETEATDA